MSNALAYSSTVAGASWSRSQERVLRSRILWDWLYPARSNASAQRDDGLAGSERRALQINRLRGDLEQLGRVVGYGRLHMA